LAGYSENCCPPLGVKPLAYCVRNGEIAFASTVAALRAAGFGGEIDPQAVLEQWLRRNRGSQPLAAAVEARNASPKSVS
jgi:hypothetical protein